MIARAPAERDIEEWMSSERNHGCVSVSYSRHVVNASPGMLKTKRRVFGAFLSGARGSMRLLYGSIYEVCERVAELSFKLL